MRLKRTILCVWSVTLLLQGAGASQARAQDFTWPECQKLVNYHWQAIVPAPAKLDEAMQAKAAHLEMMSRILADHVLLYAEGGNNKNLTTMLQSVRIGCDHFMSYAGMIAKPMGAATKLALKGVEGGVDEYKKSANGSMTAAKVVEAVVLATVEQVLTGARKDMMKGLSIIGAKAKLAAAINDIAKQRQAYAEVQKEIRNRAVRLADELRRMRSELQADRYARPKLESYRKLSEETLRKRCMTYKKLGMKINIP